MLQQQQQQQQQQESGRSVVDRQAALQAESKPVASSIGGHASQGNPAAFDKQAQQAQHEAPQHVEAWLVGAPAQPRTAVNPAADADNKSQVNKCVFCEVLQWRWQYLWSTERKCVPAQAITSNMC